MLRHVPDVIYLSHYKIYISNLCLRMQNVPPSRIYLAIYWLFRCPCHLNASKANDRNFLDQWQLMMRLKLLWRPNTIINSWQLYIITKLHFSEQKEWRMCISWMFKRKTYRFGPPRVISWELWGNTFYCKSL